MIIEAKENLMQLKSLLQGIKTTDYKKELAIFSGSSIGQHIRHVLEFYLLLLSGSNSTKINYDNRPRDVRIEQDTTFALSIINRILEQLEALPENKEILVEANYSERSSGLHLAKSCIARELAYCIEHSIHHQAIIKTGLISMELKELVPPNFGIAYSTIRYQKIKCAQ